MSQWVKNPVLTLENVDSIPGLAQWVKDRALPQAVARIRCCHGCAISLSCSWPWFDPWPRNSICCRYSCKKNICSLASLASVLIHCLPLSLSQIVYGCLWGLTSYFASKKSVPLCHLPNWEDKLSMSSAGDIPMRFFRGWPGKEEVLCGQQMFLGPCFRT